MSKYMDTAHYHVNKFVSARRMMLGAGSDGHPIATLSGIPLSQGHLEEVVRESAAMLEALRRVDQFLTNGIELGYIRMPDEDCPDPAKEIPGLVKAFLK